MIQSESGCNRELGWELGEHLRLTLQAQHHVISIYMVYRASLLRANGNLIS